MDQKGHRSGRCEERDNLDDVGKLERAARYDFAIACKHLLTVAIEGYVMRSGIR